MNIKIECRADICMPENTAYCFIVAVAFYAACRKAVVRSVTINQVKQELNATSKIVQDKLHAMNFAESLIA